MDDKAIIELYWDRSEQAISESSAKYGGYCFAIAYNILENREDSDECVNDTWYNAWNAMPPQKPELLSAFLGKITRSLSINRLRHWGAQKRGGGEYTLCIEELTECIPAKCKAEDRCDENALSELLEAFIAQSKPLDRTLFLRRYWYLCPLKKISEESGMSESAIKMRLLRMRGRLRELLEKEGYDI